MDWVASNWIWVLIAIPFFAMHLFGHGGHGGHGGHDDGEPERTGRRPDEKRKEDRPAGHRH
jgi:hypothetical protein